MSKSMVWVVIHVVGGVINGVLAFDSEGPARAQERLLAQDYGIEPGEDGLFPWEESEDVDVRVEECEIHSSLVEE
jgi:hypothetical protein